MIEKKSEENKLSNIKYQKNDKVSISKQVDEPNSKVEDKGEQQIKI